MNIFRVKILILLLFVATVVDISAQSNSISGLVRDKVTGELLIGTNLLLYRDSIKTFDSYLIGTSSNKFGFYSFTNLSNGKYILVARNIGFETSAQEIIIKSINGKVQNNILLAPTDIELDEVSVTGEKINDVNVSTIILPPDVVEKLPSLTGEVAIFKSLQLLPGVQTASEISNGLYIRGGSPDQTLTLMDGITLYNPSHLGNFNSTFNSNAVQDITLIKGAFPAEYGGRLSSVLDIKLKAGTKQKESGTLGIGTINSFLSVEGPLNENSSFILSGRAMYYDALLKTIDGDSEIPRYNYYDINSKFTYDFEKNSSVDFTVIYSKDNMYDNNNNSDLSYDISWENAGVGINWRRILSKSTFNYTTFNFVSYNFSTNLSNNSNTATSSNYYAVSKIKDYTLRNTSEARWHDFHIARFGFELLYHNMDLKLSNLYNYNIEQTKGDEFNFLEASLFFQNETNINEIFKMNLGGRLNYLSNIQLLQFEPRISFSLSPTDYLTFKTAAAKSNQSVHLVTREDKSLPTDFWLPTTKLIRPSSSWQFVAGFESNILSREYVLSVEGYYRDMKDLYEFKSNASFNPFQDIEEQLTSGEGEAYGIEFFANKRLGKIKGWTGYTLSYTKRKFPELNNGKVFYPRYDRRHDFSIALTYEATKSLEIGITWVYASGQRITMPTGQYIFTSPAPNQNTGVELNASSRNSLSLPAYHKLDISLNYKFLISDNRCEAYINIYNLYNRQNVFSYYVTQKELLNGNIVPTIKRIVLFPFLPTVGVKINF